jgi:hypothetical protein
MICIFRDNVCTVCGRHTARSESIRTCNWQQSSPAHGPGTELKKILAKVGITASPDCACNARAAEMDRQGVEWCEANLDTIVVWLREQAETRGLPFLDLAGRMLVRRAISNARRNA